MIPFARAAFTASNASSDAPWLMAGVKKTDVTITQPDASDESPQKGRESVPMIFAGDEFADRMDFDPASARRDYVKQSDPLNLDRLQAAFAITRRLQTVRLAFQHGQDAIENVGIIVHDYDFFHVTQPSQRLYNVSECHFQQLLPKGNPDVGQRLTVSQCWPSIARIPLWC